MLPVETDRIRLRRLELRDAPLLARYRSDVDVARYQTWETMTLGEAEQFVTALPELFELDDEWAQVGIADKATDELIGDIGICRKSSRGVVEIGFTLASAAQGRGLASEACRAMLALIFSRPDVMAVEAVIDSRNAAAIALVERLGMVLEGTQPAEFKGETCTEQHFVLSRPTFEVGRNAIEPIPLISGG
jgi:RimJ/RimL family protein N-acetyltransferase